MEDHHIMRRHIRHQEQHREFVIKRIIFENKIEGKRSPQTLLKHSSMFGRTRKTTSIFFVPNFHTYFYNCMEMLSIS